MVPGEVSGDISEHRFWTSRGLRDRDLRKVISIVKIMGRVIEEVIR